VLNQLSKEILTENISKDALVGINLTSNKQIEFINLDKVEIE